MPQAHPQKSNGSWDSQFHLRAAIWRAFIRFCQSADDFDLK
ncbi:hypothetical protein X743_15010 [Mesorhizobium sp. LNHC252B00]|nr:hypothetical protein X743_15010 [Mesorhizobium sp. LNHC252B00]